MQERTDDQLDDLFRKSAEEFDPPFDPAAWQDMRSRLDAHDRPETGVYANLLRWGLLSLLTLLLSVGGWYTFRTGVAREKSATSMTVNTPASPNALSVGKHLSPTRQPAGTDQLPDQPIDATGTDRAAQPNSDRFAESASVRPSELNSSGKLDRPTRNRLTPDRPVELANRRADTKKLSANRQLRNDRVAAAAKPATDGPRPDPTGAVVRKETASSTNRTAPLTQPRRSAGNRSEPSIRRLSERTAAGATTRNVKRTGNRADHVTALTNQRESELEREINSRPDDVTKFNRQPPANRSLTDVKPDGTTPAQNFQAPVNTPATTTGSWIAEPAVLALPTLAIRPARWYQPAFPFDRDVTAEPDAADAVPRQPLAPPLPTRGLSVRFVAAPDLTTIGLRDFERPGNNVGLLLEYRLASRWSVQVGVMQSLKRYKASTTDYELPPNMQRWPVLPESISGLCNMLDIPINLRYDVLLRPDTDGQVRSRWFVSGGTTTYVLRREDYYYNYADPNDPRIGTSAYRRSWHGDSTQRYSLNQFNLSLGYERALGRRLAWQVEPFLKVPLRGIGHYKIKLLSTGAFFSLRYRL